jgi:hypothetical protein
MSKQLIMIRMQEFKPRSNFLAFFSSVGIRYSSKRDNYKNFAAYSITDILPWTKSKNSHAFASCMTLGKKCRSNSCLKTSQETVVFEPKSEIKYYIHNIMNSHQCTSHQTINKDTNTSQNTLHQHSSQKINKSKPILKLEQS